MYRRVHWDRKGFAILAQVEVGTARVHTLQKTWPLDTSKISKNK
jgi:hypothetical protein